MDPRDMLADYVALTGPQLVLVRAFALLLNTTDRLREAANDANPVIARQAMVTLEEMGVSW